MENILLLLGSYLFMEFVAWSNHKYVMHGFLWRWHKDHHVNDHLEYVPDVVEKKRFEKNDRFFLVYAIPAIVLMMTGIGLHFASLIYIASGITLYGLTYFIVHDVIIHKRLPLKFLHRNHNPFIRSVIKAHTAHHRPKSKDDFNNFGLLVFRSKYFKP